MGLGPDVWWGFRHGHKSFVEVEGERDGWWNVVKDSILASYPSEYLARIKDLNRGNLAPERQKTMIQDAHDQADWPEPEVAPGGVDCDFEGADWT